MQLKVLDHGYVELIRPWGEGREDSGDFEVGIIEAARQSTQGSFRGWDQDAKLLKYLHDNKHDTPFEFAGMVIEVQAPIFVFREWHRHRTQCLTGGTEIALVSPRGTGFSRTIKEIYELKHGRPVGTGPHCTRNGYSKVGNPVTRRARWKDSDRVGALPNCQRRMLRVIDEVTGTPALLPMADVWLSGTQEIYELKTANGLAIRCSQAHPFFTRDGWAKLEDLSIGIDTGRYGKVAVKERPIPPALRQGIGVWTTMMRSRLIRPVDNCYVCGQQFEFEDLQLDHVEPVYQNLKRALDEENLRPICSVCHRMKTNSEQTGAVTRMGVRWDRIVSIERVAEEQTFDIEVAGPHHNFIANGLVVHNSYNEMSARYTPLPDLYYQPTLENVERRCYEGFVTKNKQAGSAAKIPTYNAALWLERLDNFYRIAEAHYQNALADGIPKELARLVMPVGHYSRMRAAANLRNWLAFLTLRMDPKAQWEIRQFANAVGQCVAKCFPQTWELFNRRSPR